MKNIRLFVLLFITLIIFTNCNDCEINDIYGAGATTEFQTIFQALVNDGYEDRIFYDTEIHEYSFSLTQSKEVCKIGYQSYTDIKDRPYLIEIEDMATGAIIYSANHVFDSDKPSYVNTTSNVKLDANTIYTLRRIQMDWDPYISNTIGRVVRIDPPALPYSEGIMTITASNFYQNGGPLPNEGVPFIDLVLKD